MPIEYYLVRIAGRYVPSLSIPHSDSSVHAPTYNAYSVERNRVDLVMVAP